MGNAGLQFTTEREVRFAYLAILRAQVHRNIEKRGASPHKQWVQNYCQNLHNMQIYTPLKRHLEKIHKTNRSYCKFYEKSVTLTLMLLLVLWCDLLVNARKGITKILQLLCMKWNDKRNYN